MRGGNLIQCFKDAPAALVQIRAHAASSGAFPKSAGPDIAGEKPLARRNKDDADFFL